LPTARRSRASFSRYDDAWISATSE
jgi:hypothetical protein